MAKKLSYKALDEFLKYLLKASEKEPPAYIDFFQLNYFDGIPLTDLGSIFERLKKDGMANQITVDNVGYEKSKIDRVYITFEGKLFLQKGGYVGKLRNERISTYLKAASTAAIAIGTILAAIYSILLYSHTH